MWIHCTGGCNRKIITSKGGSIYDVNIIMKNNSVKDLNTRKWGRRGILQMEIGLRMSFFWRLIWGVKNIYVGTCLSKHKSCNCFLAFSCSNQIDGLNQIMHPLFAWADRTGCFYGMGQEERSINVHVYWRNMFDFGKWAELWKERKYMSFILSKILMK